MCFLTNCHSSIQSFSPCASKLYICDIKWFHKRHSFGAKSEDLVGQSIVPRFETLRLKINLLPNTCWWRTDRIASSRYIRFSYLLRYRLSYALSSRGELIAFTNLRVTFSILCPFSIRFCATAGNSVLLKGKWATCSLFLVLIDLLVSPI